MTIKILIISFCSLPALAQVNLSFSMGSEYYQNNEYNFSSNYTIQPFYSSKESGDFGLKISINQTAFEINSPVSEKKVNTTISDYTFEYGYPFTKNFYSLIIKQQIGMGFRHIVKDRYIISLGALGERKIPLTKGTYFLTNTSLLVAYKIFDKISLFLQPQISIYNIENFKTSYTINGGFGVSFK